MKKAVLNSALERTSQLLPANNVRKENLEENKNLQKKQVIQNVPNGINHEKNHYATEEEDGYIWVIGTA